MTQAKTPRRLLTAALTVGLLAGTAIPAAAIGTPAEVRLTQLARDLVAAGAPGVIVRVDDGHGRPIEIAQQAAWAQRLHRIDPDEEFRMGSNTKTMMATIVLQLVAEHRLGLADPVDRWLPGKVPGGAAITLRMLLNHTSGLYDYTKDPALREAMLGKDKHRWTSAELLAVGTAHPPLFPPGTQWSYSNTDYAAVGAVLERVTGSSPAELLRDRIARPLNLRHTYLPTDGGWQGRYVPGYEPDAAHMPPAVPVEYREVAGRQVDGHVDVSANDPSWGGAAGAVVSTAQDWSRFFTALMSGRLLPAAQLAQMLTTVPVNPDNGGASGLGIETGRTPCGTVWAHDGGITGYSSVNFTDRSGTRTATVLVSTDILYEFDADPKLIAADRALKAAAVCTMFGNPAGG